MISSLFTYPLLVAAPLPFHKTTITLLSYRPDISLYNHPQPINIVPVHPASPGVLVVRSLSRA